jgi:hypothetical protein
VANQSAKEEFSMSMYAWDRDNDPDDDEDEPTRDTGITSGVLAIDDMMGGR